MTDVRPRVSVLLPVRNASDTLDEAVQSILNQSFQSWEMVAVDDGSEDCSLAILEEWASRDPRIRVLSRAATGIVATLEAGRKRCRGTFIARMDADDRAAPDRLREQVSFLQSNADCALCGTHVRYFPKGDVQAGARRYEAWLNSLRTSADIERDLWIECPLAHPSFAARTEALELVGGYRDLGWPEDYDLVLRVWSRGLGLGVVPRVLLHWRESGERLSRTDARYRPNAFRELKLHFLSRTLLKGRDGIVIWGAGRIGKAFARAALRLDIPVRAFVDLDPRKLGQRIHGAPVVAASEAARLRRSLSLAAVGQPGAREEIRTALRELRWTEGHDFVAVA